MVTAKFKRLGAEILYLIFLSFSVFTSSVYAIDNPDVADFIDDFEERERIYITATNNPNNSNRDYLVAYDNYLQFLDKELNTAYKQVQSKLSEKQQKLLTQSQRNWIKFRDTEFMLIKDNWTRQIYGSSAGISRGDYKTSIVKNRVLQLLGYMKGI